MTEDHTPEASSGLFSGRSRAIRWFSNPWVGLLGSIFSVVGVGLAIYFYFVGQAVRRLVYSVNPVKTTVVKGGEASALRVLHNNQEISGDITAAQIAVWNQGALSIRPENILSPVRILLRPKAQILGAKISKATRDVIGASIDRSGLAEGVVGTSWKILEQNDGFVVQLIFAGATETTIALEGTVERQQGVTQLMPIDRVRSPAEQLAYRRHVVRLLLITVAIMGAAVSLLTVLTRAYRVRPSRPMMWANVGMFCLALAYVLWLMYQMHRAAPPFGF
jgi:hypothetical protein